MNAQSMRTMLAATVVTMALAAQAEAGWGYRRATTAYALPSVPVTAAYAPVVVAPPIAAVPVITGYAPAAPTAYYAPMPVVGGPVTAYYAPPAAAGVVGVPVRGPVTSYYAPATVIAPVRTLRRPILVVP
jgi:hypothetical protein